MINPGQSHIFGNLTLTLISVGFSVCASAQTYPDRPIRLIIPVQAGLSTNDTIPRAVGQKLAAALGQPVVMDNRVGASGQIGTRAAATSPADGYTLAVGYTTTMAVAPALGNTGFDAAATLTGVARIFTSPSLIVVGASVPAKDLKELIALAKRAPGELNFASAGTGSTPHLCGELFQSLAGIELAHVPYKSAGAAITALAVGEAQVVCQAAGSVMPLVKSGKLRPLVVASPHRVASLPDVPTAKEAGLPGFEVESWSGIVAPVRTPPAIVKRLYDEIAKALDMPDVQNFIRAQGAEPALMTPAAFNAYMRTERAKWAKVIKSRNIKID
jgi:tripartite-type tricarboxylate transporter receptor subunit TctC